jgi:outer membrane protein TolC
VRDQGVDSFNHNISRFNYMIETTKRGTVYAAYAQYAGIAKLQAAIALSQDALDNQAAELEKAKKKYELGLVSRMEVENSEAAYQKSTLSHNKTKRQCQSLVTSFNGLLGQNLETTYADFDLSPLIARNRVHALSYYLDSALAKRSEILLSKESLRLAERQFELFDDKPYMFSSIDDKREAEQAMDDARIDYDIALMDVEFEIREAYKQNQAMRGKLQYCEEQVAAAEQNLERMQKLFELGTALQSSVDAVRVSVTQAKIQLANAKIDIWLQDRKLDTICGVGPGGL